jgi:NAD-dependent DNA ligase
MGFFSKLFGTVSSEGKQTSDSERVEIVGESFYRDSFKALRQRYGTKVGDRLLISVQLMNETDNPYGVGGKAVVALVDGYKVGHIANFQVLSAFESIEAAGGSKTVSGSVLFADLRESVAKNSVTAEYFVKRFVPPPEDPEVVRKREELERKGDEGKAKLRAGAWAEVTLSVGDVVCFTGFDDNRTSLEEAAIKGGMVLGGVSKKLKLLIVNEEWLENSAKTRDAIDKGVPVTNLTSYLKANPNLNP